jgi:lysyl-tRNA synthetase class 2
MGEYRQSAIKTNLHLRARLIQSVRIFFINHGYLEVETPIRIPAPAPEAFIDAEGSGNWFLQTSPELCMKRLLAAGFTFTNFSGIVHETIAGGGIYENISNLQMLP